MGNDDVYFPVFDRINSPDAKTGLKELTERASRHVVDTFDLNDIHKTGVTLNSELEHIVLAYQEATFPNRLEAVL